MAAKQTSRQRPREKSVDLKLLCANLIAERERLQEEVRKLREEKSELIQSLGLLLCGPIGKLDKEAMLAEAATQPSLTELIAEFESAED